ncbi:MAG: HAMP domain-containing histidine kinase [Actinomycetota bacterium]|nr:HAMP domain-containing histidine kinase [Actinomycetota bacterium]
MPAQESVHKAIGTHDQKSFDRWTRDRWAPGTTAGPSRRVRRVMAGGWLIFAVVNLGLMVFLVGGETIPYHLIWGSYALLYGLVPWSRRATVVTFVAVTVTTALPLIDHAQRDAIGWAECSETPLMAVIVGLLIWHVNRHRAAQSRIADLLEDERVQAAQRELTARFGSHEVRTRLTVARGLVQLMRQDSTDPALHADAALVLGEIDKATATVTTLLHLVRADAPSEPEVVEMDDVVRRVVARWSAVVERDWAGSSSVGAVLGDAERLESGLDCLIENAVRFTGRTDTIGVEARVEGADLVISVADTGAGIPEADRERVFGVFETGSTAGELGGTGLGLALVSALVQARGGTLEVTSEVGRGSCFTMRVPAQRPTGGGGAPAPTRGNRAALHEPASPWALDEDAMHPASSALTKGA